MVDYISHFQAFLFCGISILGVFLGCNYITTMHQIYHTNQTENEGSRQMPSGINKLLRIFINHKKELKEKKEKILKKKEQQKK